MELNKNKQKEIKENKVVRILSSNINGKMSIYSGLTKIKGISWSFSNAICKSLELDKERKISSLTEEEIKKIVEFVKNPNIPSYLFNRKNDLETGKDGHLTESSLELKKSFDIKRLKKIRSYRGLRHSLKLPLRGQRTKGNFRKNKAKSVGIKKKN
jgi:small subunit ribosomal protein S13